MTEQEFEEAWNEALMRSVEDPNKMTKEDEENYWNGVGFLTILITLNIPQDNILEFEVLDYTGCVGGADETLGVDYLLKYIWGIQHYKHSFKEGMIYTFHHITVRWTRGDGYTTDDNVDYYYGSLTFSWRPWTWFKTKMNALWQKYISWRIYS